MRAFMHFMLRRLRRKNKDIPEKVDASEETTAEEILRRCSNDMLKPMFTITNSKGSSGAPSHPVATEISN